MEIELAGWLFVMIVVARGLTAGTILGLCMMIPLKTKVGTLAQASYLTGMYRGIGPRIYGVITVAMTIALTILSWWALAARGDGAFTRLLLASLGLTLLGLVGTRVSLRAMRQLRSAVDRDSPPGPFVDAFARWHIYGAACHTAGFIALSLAAPRL